MNEHAAHNIYALYHQLRKMKIIAIGRNYIEHAKELNNAIPESPVIFMKPDTALLKDNRDFYYPEFSKDIHYEVEVVVRICNEGKHVSEKFAHKYYDAVGLGIDFTARDLQADLKKKGLPWEIAKAFDHSAIISPLLPKDDFENIQNIDFSLKLNDVEVQRGNTANMIFSIDQLISYISQRITLRKGDLLYTGTPAGVGPVNIGDRLEGFLHEKSMFTCNIK